jgi:transcriptional regulator with XRE-family HTH domain
MNENNMLDWNKENLRSLRLRLGWSKSDLARRLKCSIDNVDSWEDGSVSVDLYFKGELEIMFRQCEECNDVLRYAPASELVLDENALEQIEFSRVKADFE